MLTRKLSPSQQLRLLKVVTFIGLSIPLAVLLVQWALLLTGSSKAGLGANPVDATIRQTGIWSLRILLLTLAITPFVKITGWKIPIGIRRMCGLFTFTYALVHLLMYFGLDLDLSLSDLWTEILKRWYITLGMASLTLMTPLAITSTSGWIKRLGSKVWKRIHKAVYILTPLALAHFTLILKGHQIEPWIYSSIFALLMLARLIPGRSPAKKKAERVAPGQFA